MQSFDWENSPLDRNILLEASAGTGKTYTLERLVMRLVTERKIPLSRILVVTFTNMAAREMRERIGRLLVTERESAEGSREELLRRAVADFDQASVYTIHGFCAHVLQTFPFECGLPPGSETGGDDEITGRLIQDWFRKNENKTDPFLEQGYQAAWDREKSFSLLLSRIERLIASEQLNGSYRLIPGEEEEAFLKEHCCDWEQTPLRLAGVKLGKACRDVGSSSEIVNLLKQDGLGSRLGAKTAGPFYEKLSLLDQFDNFYSLLTFLNSTGAGFFTQLNQAVVSDGQGSSPFTSAFIQWADLLPPVILEEKKSASLIRSLALLFEFRCAREVINQRNRERVRSGKLTFNDLIDLVHSLLAGSERKDSLMGALESRYDVLLVDEFQDTDIRQWEIFSSLFNKPNKNYFLIGDPKQSIYRFRGADLNVYLEVRDSLPKENRYRLDKNFRSHPRLLDGFNRFFSSLFGAEGRPGTIGYSPVGAGKPDVPALCADGAILPPVEFLRLEGEPKNRDEAEELLFEALGNQIQTLLVDRSYTLGEEPVRASHIAVLMEDNKQCVRFHKLLSDRSIPAVVFQERDIFSTREVSLPMLFLEAMIGKDRGESLKKLLLSPLVGLKAGELLFLEEKGFLDSLVLRFRIYRDKTDRGDLIGQFYRFCGLGKDIAEFLWEGKGCDRKRADHLGENFLIRLMREPGGERLYTNLRHVLEILHSEQIYKRLNTGELYRFCRSELNRNHGDETFQIRLDREGEAVKIMTLHKSKGLQFPLVFFGGGLKSELINSKAAYFTYRKGQDNIYDHLKGGDSAFRARKEAWEEKKRLYYVGLTRAESKLYLPLFQNWDNIWLSWFYLQISGGDKGDINPFEKSKLALPVETGLKACETLVSAEEDLFRITEAREEERVVSPQEPRPNLKEPILPELRLFGRYPSLLSFTSLTEKYVHQDHMQDENRAVEADRDQSREELSGDTDQLTPESIPGGTGLGNLVHTLFEEIDYTLAALSRDEFLEEEEIDLFIKEKALFYFKADWYKQYGSVVKSMVWNTLNAPLFPDVQTPLFSKESILLRQIPEEQRLHEIEFLMRVKEGDSIVLNDFRASLYRGYLKGFIDLVFIHEGRYYIADWKTTRCASGDKLPYEKESVLRIMDDHNYHLQYWIYTAALCLFMKKNHPSFDYERDFGGIFYFFNRAMLPDVPGRGLFFTRPERGELIRFLENFTEEDDYDL
jgi:exodeoxyribonuclease V beta subunit